MGRLRTAETRIEGAVQKAGGASVRAPRPHSPPAYVLAWFFEPVCPGRSVAVTSIETC